MGIGLIRNYFIFAGKQSTDFDVWISGGGTFNAPERDITSVSIPGRNGDLNLDNGRYKNIKVTYPAFISRDFSRRIEDFRTWICSQLGYQRLEDTYHPDEFRLAMYSGGFAVKPSSRNLAGAFDLAFNCKPQRFLKSGEIPRIITASSAEFYNHTHYKALPLLRVYGTGTITIGDISVTVNSQAGEYMDIDCDMMDCFYNYTNCNDRVTLVNGEFPAFLPGLNTLTKTSGITQLIVKPRWWIL